MSMSDIRSFRQVPGRQRREVAKNYLAANPVETSDIDDMLGTLRDGIMPEVGESAMLLLSVIHDSAHEGKARANALLAFFYLVGLWEEKGGAHENADAATDGNSLLDEIATGAGQEADEYLRGRMHWVRIQRLREQRSSAEEIADYTLGVLRSDEPSIYVRRRVGAALQSWSGIHHILPEDGSWLPPEGEEWESLSRFAMTSAIRAGGIVETFRGRMPRLLQDVADGTPDAKGVAHYIDAFPAPTRGLVVSPALVSSLLETTDALGRNRILAACSSSVSSADVDRLKQYADALRSVVELAGEPVAWEDRFTLLALDASVANLSSWATNEALGTLLPEALALLVEGMPTRFDNAAVRHSLSDLCGGVIRAALSSEEPTAALELIQVETLSKALEDDSPYLSTVAADACLLLARAYMLPQELVAPMRSILAGDPQTETGLCTGKDLSPEDFAIPDGVSRLTATEELHADQGYFSIGGLTEMLEDCRRPSRAWRLAVALAAYAHYTGDDELQQWVDSFSTENSAVEPRDHSPEPDGDVAASEVMNSAGTANTRSESLPEMAGNHAGTQLTLSSDQIGPFTLTEIISHLATLSSLAEDERDDWRVALTMEHQERLMAGLSEARRRRIRSIFEHEQRDMAADTLGIPYYVEVAELANRGFLAEPPRSSSVPGRLEGSLSAGDSDAVHMVPSIELLAYYRPRICLAQDRRHQWGIYFRVNALLRLARNLPTSPEAFVEPVAVHELLHHHVASRGPELGVPRSCGGFREFEEAVANWSAVQHLNGMVNARRISEDGHLEVLRRVFPTVGEGGYRGYGEWNLMDADAPGIVPAVAGGDSSIVSVEPRRYRTQKALILERHRLDLSRELRLWDGLLSVLHGHEIPMYLDFM